MRGARRSGPADLSRRPRRCLAVPVPARGLRRPATRASGSWPSWPRGTSWASSARSERSASPAQDVELLLGVPPMRGGPEVLEGLSSPLQERSHGHALGARPARPARSPSGSSSTSGWCAASATTRARSFRSTTRPTACRSAAAAATTSCSGSSGARCRRWVSRSTSSALHIALTSEERGRRAAGGS